jgi:hypothetical protein
MVAVIRPFRFEQYYWRKDNYCIEAKIDHTVVNAYKENLAYWKWHHLSDGKDIPVECMKTTSNTTETGK